MIISVVKKINFNTINLNLFQEIVYVQNVIVENINVSVTAIKINAIHAKRKKWLNAIVGKMMILQVVQSRAMDANKNVEKFWIVVIINVKKIVIKVNVVHARKHLRFKKLVTVEGIVS